MERRRIARDLHDGVVQDLAGVSFSLEASAKRSETGVAADADSLREAARCLRQSVRDLRGLLVEIYPPDLHRVGLAAALTDIVGGCNARGLKTTLEIPEDLEISDESEGLLFRIIQEALRNVTAHADADHVEIHIGAANGTVSLQIRDDGRGFSPEEARNTKGHFGLRMLEELTRERGGHLEVVSSPGHGATIQAEVPAR
jgi:signal transduction histidine kinase